MNLIISNTIPKKCSVIKANINLKKNIYCCSYIECILHIILWSNIKVTFRFYRFENKISDIRLFKLSKRDKMDLVPTVIISLDPFVFDLRFLSFCLKRQKIKHLIIQVVFSFALEALKKPTLLNTRRKIEMVLHWKYCFVFSV